MIDQIQESREFDKENMKIVKVRNSSPPFNVVKVKYCDTFLSRFIGLMFSRKLEHDSGVILVDSKKTKKNASIHMMFMHSDITVLWLDNDKVIVDKVLARKWAPIYIPKQPARYVMELHQSKFSAYSIGDKLVFENKD